MDWPSVTFGAFLSLSLFVFLNDCVLFAVLRRTFFFWHACRTVLIALMAICAAEIALMPALSDPDLRFAALIVSANLSVAALAMFIMHFLEREFVQGRIRQALIVACWLSVGSAGFGMLANRAPWVMDIHNLLAGLALVSILGALIFTIAKGSRYASYLLAALAVGFGAAGVILVYAFFNNAVVPNVLWLIMPALGLEFFVTVFAMAKRFVTVDRQREAAFEEADRALKANRTDPLTGLPNRRALKSLFDPSAKRQPSGIAIVDLDHFKQINDRFGHAVGDEVLVAVGEALAHDDVFAARLGGEEFILVLYDKEWAKQAERARQRIQPVVSRRVPHMLRPVTASAGLASFQFGEDFAKTMKRADMALYAAKQAGRNQSLALTFFEDHQPEWPGMPQQTAA